MKILYIVPSTSCGGMPQFVLKRLQVLNKIFDLYLIEMHDYGKYFPTQRNQIIELLGDKFYSLGEDKMKALDIIDNIKPDIIHLDEMPELMGNYELFKKLYSDNRTWRIVETCHNSSFRPDSEKRFYPDLYAFCTSWHEDIFGNMDAQFVTIPYPIDNQNTDYYKQMDARKKLGINDSKIHVLNVGIWTPNKAQDEVIEIAKKYPKMQFDLVGGLAGNFQSFWEPLMKDLPENVKVWGERNDVELFMQAADIFLFPSKLELSPLVIREAIGFGLPIVARNLPQYVGMYDLLSLDTDFNSIGRVVPYEISNNYSSEIFGLKHEEAYKKILERPINKQSVRIINHYIDNPYLEILGNSDSNFEVHFYDENDKCVYMNTIKANHWVKLNKQYYHPWNVRVWQDGELIYGETLNLEGKRVYIAFESKSLGDTIAWMAYVEEFRKKHKCKIICSTFWNQLFDYPEIEFIEPGTVVQDIYALYRIGYFDNKDKCPVHPVTIPLQKVAAVILGLDYVELAPKLSYEPKVPEISKYVTISTNSTSGLKFWGKSQWQELINWLASNGYSIFNVSQEPNPFDNCVQITTPSLESKMDWIAGAKFHISLSSGLGWVAYAMGKHVVMIANFTEEWNEFQNNITRIVKKDVCYGCWNNPEYKFDPGNWSYCPKFENTNRQWECQLSITSEMVIDKIKQLL